MEGIRFEVPSRFGHLTELWVRYASWDLSTVHLADPKTGAILCRIYPVDKIKNAEGRRAPRGNAPIHPRRRRFGVAPLLQKIIQQYAATGLPPAYLPSTPQPITPKTHHEQTTAQSLQPQVQPFFLATAAGALWVTPQIQSFCWRIEQQIGEGGFALAVGDPGVGKSATLRILSEHLNGVRDLCVGTLTRPQAKMADFYRELGHLFGVALSPSNRWHSSKSLREKWLTHIEAAVYRPVLIIDEAQEMNPLVLSELRLLASADLDSRSILTIILAGDQRLATRLEEPDWLPVASRIRSRLRLEALPPNNYRNASVICSKPPAIPNSSARD